MIIGGKYNGGATTYYRIDFAKNTATAGDPPLWTYMPVLRNNSYTVTIKDINGPGEVDEITALESIPANIDADIVDWVNEEIKEVTSNGLYMLGVSSSRFVLPKPEHTEDSDGNELYITTIIGTDGRLRSSTTMATGKSRRPPKRIPIGSPFRRTRATATIPMVTRSAF